MKYLPPSQYDLENFIRSRIKWGSETNIARRLYVTPEQINQEFNPHHEKKSKIYQGVCELCAVADEDGEAGIAIVEELRRLVYKAAGRAIEGETCISELAAKAAQESLDVAKAVLTGASDDEIHQQAIEAVDANSELAKAMTGKLKRDAIDNYNLVHKSDKTEAVLNGKLKELRQVS